MIPRRRKARSGSTASAAFPYQKKVSGAELITPKALHEARQLRDAEAADPGVIRRALDARLERGREPTKATVRV
jgi:hypothetical protein